MIEFVNAIPVYVIVPVAILVGALVRAVVDRARRV
jgi:hypothetical protein